MADVVVVAATVVVVMVEAADDWGVNLTLVVTEGATTLLGLRTGSTLSAGGSHLWRSGPETAGELLTGGASESRGRITSDLDTMGSLARGGDVAGWSSGVRIGRS